MKCIRRPRRCCRRSRVRARVRALALAVACDIHPLNNTRVLKYLENELGVPQPERERMMKRLESWLESQIATRLKPLVELSEPAGLNGLARGIAFRLVENFGSLRRGL